ncbi:MAG: segregation/condensation protein A [Candidatus Hydrogenedentota bacterium]
MSDDLNPALPQPGSDTGEGVLIVDEATDEVLRLHLDKFQGPMEVLLYLIKAQEIDILDIPILKITDQYLRFLDLLQEENLDMAGEYLVMAATLLHIKSKMLLPADQEAASEEEEIEEEDPRLELVNKLLEYRLYREVAQRLEWLEGERLAWFTRNAKVRIEEPEDEEEEYIEVTLFDLMKAMRSVLHFFTEDLYHNVTAEHHSVDDKIDHIRGWLAREGSVAWTDLLRECKQRVELICCFLAILELCRQGQVKAHQHRLFDEIRLFPAESDPPAVPAA